jgi:predicted Zn-dependent protease
MIFAILLLFPFVLFSNLDDDFKKGLDWTLELSKHIKILDEHPDLEKINYIGYSLASNLEDNNLYSFQIVDMKEANAFAIPGGFIFVTKGMLDLKLSDDGIAALLSHEIIHIKNQHSNKMEKRQTLLSALSNILLLGVLFGVKDDTPSQNLPPWWSVPDSQWDKYGTYETKKGNLIEGTIAFSIIFQELLMQGYSREYEMEADREGTYLMAKGGFSPQGIIELMEKLKRHYWEAPDLGYFRSHPYLEDRLELAKVRVSQLKEASKKEDVYSYRKKIQEKFYFLSIQEKDKDKKKILFKIAKNSCSKGILSLELNLKELQELEKNNLSKNVYERKFSEILERYEKVINKFQDDMEVQFTLKKVKSRYEEILKEKEECFPLFKNHFYDGFPSSEYLSSYYENYKDKEIDFLPFIFYGSNLIRLGEEEKGVEIFLNVYKKGEEEIKDKILEEISAYGKNFKNLKAIYSIYSSFNEDFIKLNFKFLFMERLKKIQSLSDLREFLDKFPRSDFYDIAFKKLEEEAEKNYVKGRAFKSVGDFQSALEIYNKILENAYDTNVAEKIREELKEGG